MCEGVYFTVNGRESRFYFQNPGAALPVRNKRTGALELVPWGRRPKQSGTLPLGGSVRVELIRAGRWDKFFPKSVLIAARAFGLRDFEGQLRWYDLVPGQWLHGAYLCEGTEQRVYILTLEPDLPEVPHPLWPKVISHT